MPKPLLFRRPSGWYVRFLVPVHARAALGSRFVVRALGNVSGDHARLAAAHLGYALSHQCAALKGPMPTQTLWVQITKVQVLDPQGQVVLEQKAGD